jgi:hypothetical protein
VNKRKVKGKKIITVVTQGEETEEEIMTNVMMAVTTK